MRLLGLVALALAFVAGKRERTPMGAVTEPQANGGDGHDDAGQRHQASQPASIRQAKIAGTSTSRTTPHRTSEDPLKGPIAAQWCPDR